MLRKLALTILFAVTSTISLVASDNAKDDPQFLVAIGSENLVGIQPGRATCAGGRPTGKWFPDAMCTAGTDRILTRAEVDSTQLTGVGGTGAAMFAGATNRLVVNCNLDANLKGYCWGTFEITLSGGQGKFEGTWTGPFDLTNLVGFYSGDGHGSGGQLHGLRMKYVGVYPGFPQFYATFIACVTDK